MKNDNCKTIDFKGHELAKNIGSFKRCIMSYQGLVFIVLYTSEHPLGYLIYELTVSVCCHGVRGVLTNLCNTHKALQGID